MLHTSSCVYHYDNIKDKMPWVQDESNNEILSVCYTWVSHQIKFSTHIHISTVVLHIYNYTYVLCIHTWVYTSIHWQTDRQTHMYRHKHVRTYTRTCTHTHTLHIQTHVYIHTYTETHTDTDTHTHANTPSAVIAESSAGGFAQWSCDPVSAAPVH